MDVPTSIYYVAIILSLYTIYGIVYRLYLSPISKFPGPKLAAITWWYEYYYDVILRGKYIWKIQELHERYGPIIRINPYELHVIDPTFRDTLYAGSAKNKRDRWSWHARGMGIDYSMLGTVEHNLHRQRRAALGSFFSKQNVERLQEVMDERIDTFLTRLRHCAEIGKVVNIDHAYSAFTNDVVMQYCFGRNDHRVEADNFDPTFHAVSFNAGISGTMMRHNHWIMRPEAASFVILKRERIDQLEAIRREGKATTNDTSHATIFHDLLKSNLPESEKTSERLAEEAVLLVGAGTHTAAWALTVMTFHLLSQPTLLKQLKDELKTVQPEIGETFELARLEKLPFLTAVIKEGLRLSYGATSRLPRVAPDTPLAYEDWVIPPGTPVSMMIPLTHHYETIFPDSYSFKPSRWLDDATGHLDKYLVSFSRGSRACLGINLAWSELYLCAAGLFSKFGTKENGRLADGGFMELYETDVSDVQIERDLFFPVVKDGSKGVRVKFTT
ncbi:hypothetical protein B7463_g6694, partial [Scytalidium lignicola]